jgi:hypothetical protein
VSIVVTTGATWGGPTLYRAVGGAGHTIEAAMTGSVGLLCLRSLRAL